MKDISKFFNVHRIRDISAATKDEALIEMCGLVANAPEVNDPDRFLTDIRNREKIMSTGIGTGIAIPHAKSPAVKDFVIAVGRCKQGIDFESLDGLPVNIIILMGAPERKRKEFLKFIARIGAIFNEPGFKDRFLEAKTPEDIFNLLA